MNIAIAVKDHIPIEKLTIQSEKLTLSGLCSGLVFLSQSKTLKSIEILEHKSRKKKFMQHWISGLNLSPSRIISSPFGTSATQSTAVFGFNTPTTPTLQTVKKEDEWPKEPDFAQMEKKRSTDESIKFAPNLYHKAIENQKRIPQEIIQALKKKVLNADEIYKILS